MKCPVCGLDNSDFKLRCKSCGAILQQRSRTLNLFEIVALIWKNPELAQKRILLAEHRNLTFLIAIIESFAAGFAFLFAIKATDTYSTYLPYLLLGGMIVSILVFLPFLYLVPLIFYILAGVRRTGITIKGFVSAFIYSVHPLAFTSLVLIPVLVAVFGQYSFSNNPSPEVINPLPFYALIFLNVIVVLESLFFLWKLVFLIKPKPLPLFILIVGLIIGAVFCCSSLSKYILLH
ncbi:MAG: hypothetical protein ACP5US_05060 [Candidatus Kryptoniota bacterium]